MDIQFIDKKNKKVLKRCGNAFFALSGFILAAWSFFDLASFIMLLIAYLTGLSIVYLYIRKSFRFYHIDELSDDLIIDNHTYSLTYIYEVSLMKQFYVVELEDILIYLPRIRQVDEFIKDKEWKVNPIQSNWHKKVYEICVIVLMVYMFYQVFIMLFGLMLCIFMNYQVISIDVIGLRFLQIGLIIVVRFIMKRFKNKKIIWIFPCFMIVVLAYINMMTYISSENIQGKGNIAYIPYKNDLYLYQNVYKEYGILDETLHHVDNYQIYHFSDLVFVKYQQDGQSHHYLFYRQENTSYQRDKKIKEYDGLILQNEMYNVEFHDEVLRISDGKYHGQLDILQSHINLINDDFLEIIDDHKVKYYLFLPVKEQIHSIRIIDIETMTDDHLSFKEMTKNDEDQVNQKSADKKKEEFPQSTIKSITQEEKNENGQMIVQKLNEVAKNIDHFQTNKEIVKIEATTQDYNLILKDIAKLFTINNNNDLKIDTQILRIDVTSGDIQEFGAHVFDRQDIEGQEKCLNNYYYRVKKVDNYYIAVRVEEDTNVDIGLKKLDEPISTDTSYTTDYLYCIEGKKEVEGW